ncbi:thioredoxin family protein [Flavobacteriaceae bacterium]|jgi:thioredoxin 1|nr:thioredoxin family protein [Flavobacteriaceae bacterium]
MSKFGELIDVPFPVLLQFYTEWSESAQQMHEVLNHVAAALGDKGKVIKIDVDKNQVLSEALRVKTLPTLMIYKQGEMLWRQSGEQDANTLLIKLKEHI